MTNWLPLNPLPPIDPDYDYGDWYLTIKVMCHNGKQHYMCRLQVYLDEGVVESKKWILDGPDGLEIKGIRYWSYLPAIN